MPKGVYDRSKHKPKIQQRTEKGTIEDVEVISHALTPEEIAAQDKTLTGAPEPSVQTSTGEAPAVTSSRLTYDDVAHAADEIEAQKELEREQGLLPLLSLHLRRVGNELTDVAHTVHIPSPSLIQPGERVVIHVYREG